VVDLFQTGSGTSTNMNMNEVLANRALTILGRPPGERSFLHPLEHVNLGQSSNDLFPSLIHIAAHESLQQKLLPALQELHTQIVRHSEGFAHVVKAGRTHLQDAVPITLGQEFGGYAAQLAHSLQNLTHAAIGLRELALGGTAVGTGFGRHPDFARLVISSISARTGTEYRETSNHFAAQSSLDIVLDVSGQLRNSASILMKIANDIRWLASGPRGGLGEIHIPETQPGSSIIPAKTNPVICESLMMVCAHVLGNDTAVTICHQHSNFELNTMMPLIAFKLIESIELLAEGARNFSLRCVAGITANEARCRELAESSLALVTRLVPRLGYDTCAEIGNRAAKEGISIREVVTNMKLLDEATIQDLLDPLRMTEPGIPSTHGMQRGL